jgi:LytS/YehU family sensor histidine kinase
MMKRYFIHNPVFRIVAPAVYGVLLYLLILLINNNVTEVNALFSSQELYVMIGLSYLSIEICRTVIVLLNRFVKESESKVRAIILQVTATTVLSVGAVIGSIILYFDYALGFSISTTQLWIFSIIFIVTSLLYNILYLSNYYLHKENTLRLNAEKQQRQVLELEMQEFKNDINPDLLYESLEGLIALMYRDLDQAEEYIDCLASTYRYVLSNRQLELVKVSEEINAAQNIVKLLNEKNNGLIKFQSSLHESEVEALLIPGSLPLIIESLVRNTIINRFEPFLIQCYIEDDYITIQSKLNDKLMLHQASEHAFARLQKSYSLYSDLPLIKVKAYQENYIKLPLITFEAELT